MPSPFHGIQLASSALRSFQRAMDVSGHNLANVNTRGYSRQIVEFSSSEPTTFFANGVRPLGTGTGISGLSRARESFLESRMHAALSDQGRSQVLAENMIQIEAAYNETDGNGISDALDKFFNAWSALGSSPNDLSARITMKQAAMTLTARVRETYQRLEAAETQTNLSAQDTITRVNELATEVHQLNKQIVAQRALGTFSPDLEDQRDLALQELSQLVPISTQANETGSVAVTVANFPLVQEFEIKPFPTTLDPVNQTVTDGTFTVPIRGGKLLGQLQSLQRNEVAMTDLDNLANALRTQINAIHSTGTNRLGNTGVNFFNDAAPQTGAVDFELSAEVLASADAIATSTSGNAGDGSLALQLAGLRDDPFASLGNKTFGAYLRDGVSEIASETLYFNQTYSTHAAIVEQVDAQIQSVSGVNLDEEMADLVRFQRSYQAAAKVLSILDQTTEELINVVR